MAGWLNHQLGSYHPSSKIGGHIVEGDLVDLRGNRELCKQDTVLLEVMFGTETAKKQWRTKKQRN